VPLWVDSDQTATCQPVTVGLPLPKGLLTDPPAANLVDDAGRPVCWQGQALARWTDGSVKWLLADFVLPPLASGRTVWVLAVGGRPAGPGAATSLGIEESGQEILVGTGAAEFHLDLRSLLPVRRAVVGGRDVLEPGSAVIRLTDASGQSVPGRVERAAFEERGPVRATLRLEGRFGRSPCRFVARVCFFAGTGLVRVRLTLHNPRRARHPGGLWDLGDRGSVLFRALALELKLKATAVPHLTWTAEAGQPLRSGNGSLSIYQDSSGGRNWQSHNHVNRDGKVPCRFRGYRVRPGDEELAGLRASPVVTLSGENGALTAAVPEFWQQFPKALEVDGGLLRVGLFPRQCEDLFELQGGEQKTHTLWLHFGAAAGGNPLGWAHSPATVRATPQCYAATGAIPYLTPERSQSRLEVFLREAIAGEKSLLARREVIDEYGWRHFGEVYGDHEARLHRGLEPLVSHYNNQYDPVYGGLLQFWRTGEPDWLGLFDPLARHVIDIDIYHTDRDKAAYNGGLFWFTDHYKDAATCTHRTYSRANCRPGDRTYGGGPGSSHNFTTGLLHYYYQTGDPQARDAVLSLADWVINMDDGRRSVLGLIDDGPTGLASYTAESGYHGPGRGCGLSVNALLDAWLLTGQRTYLGKAEELIRRCVHPADDVAQRDLLDVERRWSYTVFFSVLARYLGAKAEAGALDTMYAYAQASLVHYAAWMLDNERPYFDHPENLEYPTEAWAAQEMRKANVLRLAALHAGEPLRGRLLKRGEELADRAWSDLERFESRGAARAVAILMAEGTLDAYFRTQEVPAAPRAAGAAAFGSPAKFVPQKQRVLTQLKTVRGLARALLRLASPRAWRQFVQGRRGVGVSPNGPPEEQTSPTTGVPRA
jgi:hypothetical protein